MKMLMIVCPAERQKTIRELIASHDVHAYTELQDVTGEGLTGKRHGTQVWPRESLIVLTIVSDEKKDELLVALKECAASLFPAEGMRAFVLPVEEAI